MSEILTPAVVEQLRILDGHLFQDEQVLSVYLDTKSFVWTYLSSTIRNNSDSSEYLQWKDAFAENLTKLFLSVRPSIEKDLYEVVRKQSSMLGNHNDSIIANPHVSKYLHGIFRRILQHDSYTSKQMIDQDPIKIDFVFREAFRSCLYNDCLTLFEGPKVVQSAAPEPPADEPKQEPVEDQPKEVQEKPQEDASSQASSEEDRKTIAKSIAKTIVQPLETKSILKGPSSVVSHAMSAITSVSTIKKPKVKTVFLQEDDAVSRFTRITSRN